LVRWLKVNFSECFCAWIHVKALRVFVESVLRLVEYIIYNVFFVYQRFLTVDVQRMVTIFST